MSYFFTTLCHCLGQWQSVGGGPNCPLRWFPKPGALGTRFLRAWRLETTDRDSLLLLRQMVITALAHQASGQQVVHSVLEHPKDPLDCSLVPAAGRYKVFIHLFGLQKYMRKGP